MKKRTADDFEILPSESKHLKVEQNANPDDSAYDEDIQKEIVNPSRRHQSRIKTLYSDDEDEENPKALVEDEESLSGSFLDAEAEEPEDPALDRDSFTPFNLQDEEDEGRFDADGNFIRNEDTGRYMDSWLDGYPKKNQNGMQGPDDDPSREQRMQSLEKRAASDAENAQKLAHMTREQAWSVLYKYVPSGSTVTKALSFPTINKKQPPPPNGPLLRHKKSPEELERIERITEACEVLLEVYGVDDIYDRIITKPS